MRKNSIGFTIIELLVVIGIIGVVASIVLTSLNNTRIKGRNAKRIGDIKSIQSALEIYNNSEGAYPIGSHAFTSCNSVEWGSLENSLVPYLKNLPEDPLQDCATDRYYLYLSDGENYKIVSHNPENSNDPPDAVFIDPARDGGADFAKVDGSNIWAWAIYTSIAAAW